MCADLTLARAKLGFQPRVGLQDGLQRMLARDLRFQRTQPTTA
jgi:nucleoside-diphosphate-sugar epimerase